MNNLKSGSRGPEVQQLQEYLRGLGLYNGNIDGIFGNKTDAAVKAFQAQQNVKIDGNVGPITRSKMKFNSQLGDLMNDPGVMSALQANPQYADMLEKLVKTGDVRGNVVMNFSQSANGQILRDEDMQALYDQEYEELGGYYGAMQDMEKSALNAQLGLQKRDFQRFLESSASNFKQDKDNQDTGSAQNGVLFSTGREEKLRNLEGTYRSNESAARDNLSTNMGNSMRDYQYNWGGDGMRSMSRQNRLGSQSYDAFTPRGVVNQGGMNSVYNPSQHNFAGVKKDERRKFANVYAQNRAANRGNKQGVYGHQTQF